MVMVCPNGGAVQAVKFNALLRTCALLGDVLGYADNPRDLVVLVPCQSLLAKLHSSNLRHSKRSLLVKLKKHFRIAYNRYS